MARKSKRKEEELRLQREREEQLRKEKELETEAYEESIPDAGMNTTFTKVVGNGGPTPIVAPKHTTIQLQPIIVPLAVVPYMTADSDVLKTEDKQSAGEYNEQIQAAQGANIRRFEEQTRATAKQKSKARKRLLASFTMFFALLCVAYYLLAHFVPNLFSFLGSENVDPIGALANWINGQGGYDVNNKIYIIMFMLSFVGSGLISISALVDIFIGRYTGGLYVALALLTFASTLIALVMNLVKQTFAISKDGTMIAIAALTLVLLFVIIIFASVNRSKDNKLEEDVDRATAVI